MSLLRRLLGRLLPDTTPDWRTCSDCGEELVPHELRPGSYCTFVCPNCDERGGEA